MILVLKQALEALEANYQLINGTRTKGGLAYCMDNYYSDCFDVDPINKQTDEAIAAIKEALAQQEQEPVVEMEALADNDSAYAYADGWNACVRKFKATHPPQRIEQNFCPRCGKRTNDIHTCTPPKEKNNGS